MRIGEVNKDNYMDFLRILGVKEPKNLGGVLGKDDEKYDNSFEARSKRWIEKGWADEGMIVSMDDDGSSWKKIVNVSDSAKQKVIDKVRENILASATGRITDKQGTKQGDELAAIIKDYYMTLPPGERLSASWTLQKISQAEAGRIGNYLKSQIPGWEYGQAFDTRILTDSNFGLGAGHLDLRV